MANRAGMNYRIQPTPAVALGAYEITPLEAAGAYTMFANQGVYVKPSFLTLIRSQDGKVVYRNQVEQKQVLDPRVAYLMTNMMEEVLRSGTAAGVRARYNLNFPVAGKTGTSHDGWFAGYTSELLCVVWVGFDNNQRTGPGGRPFRGSHLGGIHEAGARFPRVSRYQAVPSARWHRDPHHRSAVRHAGHRPTAPRRSRKFTSPGRSRVGSCPLHGGRQRRHQRGRLGSRHGDRRAAGATSGAPSVAGQIGAGAVARRAARQNPPIPRPQPANGRRRPSAAAPSRKKQKRSLFRRLLGVFKYPG